eukprot:g10821.t1
MISGKRLPVTVYRTKSKVSAVELGRPTAGDLGPDRIWARTPASCFVTVYHRHEVHQMPTFRITILQVPWHLI